MSNFAADHQTPGKTKICKARQGRPQPGISAKACGAKAGDHASSLRYYVPSYYFDEEAAADSDGSAEDGQYYYQP